MPDHYLSRLILDPHSRAVRMDLADCHALHRRLMTAFPDVGGPDARARLGVLYRLEPRPRESTPTVLVQSGVAPDWTRLPDGYLLETGGLPENPASRAIDHALDAVRDGMLLTFRLLANPTKTVSRQAADEPASAVGKRVELRDEPSQLAWLARQGERGGFALVDVRTRPGLPDVRVGALGKLGGRRGTAAGTQTLTLAAVLFEGQLRVTDVGAFRETVARGIGHGKAYGLGLLSLAPPRGW